MIQLSDRVKNICPSQTLAITSQVLKMRAEGKKIISFGAGEPDFDTPTNIREEAIKAIKSGFTHYTTDSGIPELKNAVIDKLKRDQGLSYHAKQILISNGAKHSLYNALMALCNPGDEVLLPTPCWVSYTEQIKLAQAKPVFIETKQENQFELTAELVQKSITDRTKILLLNTPNNPTGAVYNPEELKKIAEILVKKDIYCISDEIYEKLVYDDAEHVSIASFGPEIKEKVILINGMSKSYAMTGWRIGYTAGPEEIIFGMSKLQGHCTSNANSIAQKASVEGLEGNQDSIESMRTEFDRRRRFMVQALSQIKGFQCDMPKGAFYAFPNITQLFNSGLTLNKKEIKSSLELADFILSKAEVAVVPGVAFEAEGYLRLSYATSMPQIEEGMKRLEKLFQ
ncbi:MAG: pyridoxal phosphate-dependent aminotransferase [Candidatus Atribacteria bacterium]|nr:pyridoxal phosphate-dependent aminotransferase [Candidatus Atribacteria bacterium]